MPDRITRALEGIGPVPPVGGAASSPVHRQSAALSGHAQREALYAAAVHCSNLAFLTTDSNGIITGWNPGAERLFGYSADEVIGRDIEVLVPADRRDEIATIRDKFRRGARIENFATVRLTKDNRPVHVIFDISPLRTATDELIGSSAIVRDVTEQRLAEDLFGLAVEACPSGMMMIDRAGRIVMVNSEVEHLFGYRREELLNKPVEMLVPRNLRAKHEKLRADFTEHPQSRSMGKGLDLFGLCKDGSEFPIEINLNSVRISDGLLILAVVVDISERKRSERQKDEFVSTVSHELRTPLTSIAASLALLLAGRAGELPPPALRLVEIAHSNGQRLVRLVNDILDIEKMESGQTAFDFKKVAARAIVEQAIEASRAYAEQFDVKVRLESDSVAGEVRADADRLAQVVTNLLSNAIKFSPRGEDVILTVGEREHTVRIAVRDHGSGIPEEFKPRVFEKFAQADASDTRQKGGTGLGLNIVKQIVDRLGGKVGFESASGYGSLFYVELPSWQAEDEYRAPAIGRGMKVLLCEDDPGVAAALSTNLFKAGFAPHVVTTVDEALRQADRVTFAAVLVDLKLPDGDGIGLIQKLRNVQRYHHTPIIAVSGDATGGPNELRASALDIVDWLDKPVDLNRLVRVLERPDIRGGSDNLRILLVEDDANVRATVAEAMRRSADVESVASIEDARRALVIKSFDLAVIDVAISSGSGPELLVELRNRDGSLIPVILLSAQSAHTTYASRVREALAKSSNSVDSLIAILAKRLGIQMPRGQSDKGGEGDSHRQENRIGEKSGNSQEVA